VHPVCVFRKLLAVKSNHYSGRPSRLLCVCCVTDWDLKHSSDVLQAWLSVPCFRRLDAGLPPWRRGFDPSPVYAGFMVNEWHWDNSVPKFFRFPLFISLHQPPYPISLVVKLPRYEVTDSISYSEDISWLYLDYSKLWLGRFLKYNSTSNRPPTQRLWNTVKQK
jgi:hypothetical protein